METEMQTDGNKQAGRAGKIKLRRADVVLLSEQVLLNAGKQSRRHLYYLDSSTSSCASSRKRRHHGHTYIGSEFGPWLIIRLVEAVSKVVGAAGAGVRALTQPGGTAAPLLGLNVAQVYLPL